MLVININHSVETSFGIGIHVCDEWNASMKNRSNKAEQIRAGIIVFTGTKSRGLHKLVNDNAQNGFRRFKM